MVNELFIKIKNLEINCPFLLLLHTIWIPTVLKEKGKEEKKVNGK